MSKYSFPKVDLHLHLDLDYLMTASTIIFDFDGTLHDSLYIYRIAFARGYQWLVEQGKAPQRTLTEADMAANIGLTAQEAWGRICPDIPWSVSKDAAARVGRMMDELISDGTARLYPGVPEMLVLRCRAKVIRVRCLV